MIEGATLLAPERIDAALAPSMGADRTIDDLQRARAALESMYARRGYGATQVLLPEQGINDGVVPLRVVEVKLGAIRSEGNRFFDDDDIRASLPAHAVMPAEGGRPTRSIGLWPRRCSLAPRVA